jgi:hypothetical protein
MSRLPSTAAYLGGALGTVALAGALALRGASDLWVVARLLYYVLYMMTLYFLVPALLVTLASGRPFHKGLVVLAAIGGCAVALFLKAWLFNPSCRQSKLWEPMCFEGVKAAMELSADGFTLVLTAHIIGVVLWMATLKLLRGTEAAH